MAASPSPVAPRREATAEQWRLAELKRLVFINLVNGVPPPQVAHALKLSLEEVDRHLRDVLLKLQCYMRDRNMPGFAALEILAAPRKDRRVCLYVLERLGPIYLASGPRYKRFSTMPIDEEGKLIHELTGGLF
jgi:hypothetical protein